LDSSGAKKGLFDAARGGTAEEVAEKVVIRPQKRTTGAKPNVILMTYGTTEVVP
jgi:hypothetical protein